MKYEPVDNKLFKRNRTRLVELLKQGQYSPVNVEMQVIHILAGTEGFCDDIETTEVNNFIADLTAHFEKNESELLKEIVERGTLKKEGLRGRVLDAIKAFRTSWN